jgi:uncharacterized protein DUF3306
MVAEENFLRRWSRRKRESVKQSPESAPPAASAPAAAPVQTGAPSAPASSPELPSIDSLRGLASDYKEFLNPGVAESLRRSALKKLFHDPHFNVMDGLDVYIDDYSKPDPMPESMLKELLARHREFSGAAEDAEAAAAPQLEQGPPASSDAPSGDAAPEAPAAAEPAAPPEREVKPS